MRALRITTVWKASMILLTAWTFTPTMAGAATLTVCASGCDHTAIAAAHAAAASGDTIEVQDAVHTEAGIVIDKSVTIQGLGATATIVQAAATPGTATDRVFFINDDFGSVSVTLRRMTIRHGKTDGGGGGIHARAQNFGQIIDLRVEDVILTANQAVNGGAILGSRPNFGKVNLTIVDSTITGNTASRWSALFVDETVTMTGCTVSGNTDTSGNTSDGVIQVLSFTIANSTVSGNTGGGISAFSNGSITNTTVTANTLTGVRRLGGAVSVSNSIVWDNGTDCAGPLTIPAGAPNLDGDGTCTGFTLQNADADLGLLQNNGGPTETHALGGSSAAIDTGDDAICAASPINGVDQRGVARPQSTQCDLGAFEAELVNQAPVCTSAAASPSTLFVPLLPPLFPLVPISITGVTDPDGDPVTITATSIFQDEPVSELILGLLTSPDGTGVGTSTPKVRAERRLVLLSNGRVYHIHFTASDGNGGSCNGDVQVTVPLIGPAIDGGPHFDSTVP